MSQRYLYLKLLLRNNLQLKLDEYSLIDTGGLGLVCNFMGMKLASTFQPVLRGDGKIIGHQALLQVELPGRGESTPEIAFENAIGAGRLVQFDRLVRIVHLINHARGFGEDDLLILKVHPALLAGVGNHGRTFERILHYYSVPTSQVVIELQESEETAILTEAVDNYRSLGYRIAVGGFGAAHSSLERVLALQPDIVKLDGELIQAAGRSRSAEESFARLVQRFQDSGIKVAVEGIESITQLNIARKNGAELLQGHFLTSLEALKAGHAHPCLDRKLAA